MRLSTAQVPSANIGLNARWLNFGLGWLDDLLDRIDDVLDSMGGVPGQRTARRIVSLPFPNWRITIRKMGSEIRWSIAFSLLSVSGAFCGRVFRRVFDRKSYSLHNIKR